MDAQIPVALAPLFKPARYKFVRGGRGSGKSWGVARALLIQAAQSPQRILCTREVQASIKDSVHALLKDQIQALKLGAFFEVLETEIRGRNGSRFAFRGLSDMTADSVKSFEGCTRVWLEEAQTITERSWRILTPTIRAPGSEIWATYNPQLDTDPTHIRAVVKAHPDTWSAVMNWRDNPWFPAELDAERLHAKEMMSEAEYLHVWEGLCMPAVEGAIYADEMARVESEHRVTRAPADPMLKTHAIWDLGFADSMAIICAQRAASEIRIVDYIEDTRRALPTYVEQLKALPYNWGQDWLPHDGFAVKHQTGKADAQVLRALGRQVQQTPGAEVEQGIRAARLVFPRIWFNDTPQVRRLVECLKRYRRNVSSRTGEPGSPRHDEFSHGADAFRYLCLVADRLTNDGGKRRTIAADEPTGSWMGS
jgi:phage terminase large subunit